MGGGPGPELPSAPTSRQPTTRPAGPGACRRACFPCSASLRVGPCRRTAPDGPYQARDHGRLPSMHPASVAPALSQAYGPAADASRWARLPAHTARVARRAETDQMNRTSRAGAERPQGNPGTRDSARLGVGRAAYERLGRPTREAGKLWPPVDGGDVDQRVVRGTPFPRTPMCGPRKRARRKKLHAAQITLVPLPHVRVFVRVGT